jgi:xylose isomerase
MVVESVVQGPVFITEKTMKPLAFQHPFIVYGPAGVLSTLRAWGFETFNNIWDESYDQITNTERRRDAVVAVVNSLQVDSYSSETLEKLQHNRNHFFDRARIANGIVKEIIEPLLHYAET